MQNQQDILYSLLQKNVNSSNIDIARLATEQYPMDFNGIQPEVLRKRISRLRKKHKLHNHFDGQASHIIKENDKYREESKVVNKRINTLEDLVEVFLISPKVWTIISWECTSYESHTKLRHYDGKQRIDDEHKVVPLYRVQAKMVRNMPVILAQDIVAEVIEEMKAHAPIYKPIKYNFTKFKNPCLLEVNLFDLHFGKMCWSEEVGQDFDIKIAKERFIRCLQDLVEHAKSYNIERIVFPIGNDFFNVDTLENTTAKGTPQDEDTRWKKTFKRGRQLMIEAIDMLRQVAPVDVLVIPGNHDKQRSFYLGEVIEAYYTNCSDVVVDNTANARKYYKYGHCLIGYTHGSDEPIQNLPMVMATEMQPVWDVIKYAEWHLGDKHHKKEIKWLATEEMLGVIVRFMRSLTSTDAWHHSKAYVGNPHAGEAFVWNRNDGLVSQFTAIIEDDVEVFRKESLSDAKDKDGAMALHIKASQ